VASYVFPAGGQRGTTVRVCVGGLFLHETCSWELSGSGLTVGRALKRVPNRWFEGPLLPLAPSQQAEDYPRELAGEVKIAGDAPVGLRRGRVWTSEGAAGGLRFVVGELPEVVEEEVDGDPVPVPVKLPVTINGRIFPREDIDDWSFTARKGEVVHAEVQAARIGSPLEPWVQILDDKGRVLTEKDNFAGDSFLSFTAPADGTYRVRIRDAQRQGGQNFVYRLTLTTGPRIERVYPAGGRKGSRVRLEATGPGVPAGAVEVTLPDKVGLQRVDVPLPGGATGSALLDVEDLPEQVLPSTVEAPAVLNGRIARPGMVDTWQLRAGKGKAVQLELRALGLGSPLQGVLEITDEGGKVLQQASANNGTDPVLLFQPPADGVYRVRVRDRFRSRGGPAFLYRLRLGTPRPEYSLAVARDALTVSRGGRAPLRVQVERRGGFTGPIQVEVEGVPAGVKVAPLTIAAGQPGADLVFQADPKAPIGPHWLRLEGKATLEGKVVTWPATVAAASRAAADGAGLGSAGLPARMDDETVLLGVGLVAPFKVKGSYDLRLAARGTVFRKHYTIERNGFTGPLEVRLADRQARHLQGVTGPVLTIPPGVSEFDYPVTLPPWMLIGRTSRSCVMLTGVVEEAGVRHIVSSTSTAQNDQIIAVVETGRLGVEVERSSWVATPGSQLEVPVRIRRGKGLNGPATIRLLVPEHVRGVTVDPLTIPEGQQNGTLRVHISTPSGPFNLPLVVRATVEDAGSPVTAETALQFIAR
jgi:hypothetical protein